ncbi:MAG: carbonic anhydrase [Verrucomicrobiales bacterium]|nr:carbonic anhydrase [Verrucomicrobiales bacterium]
MHKAITAFNELVEGNRRFADGKPLSTNLSIEERRAQLVESQAPSAIILGCSDSRAPAEILFDQGLGDLFVIRVAGNIVAPSGIGSIEYAVEALGVRLIVVLGHSSCGAVRATVDELKVPRENRSPNLESIVRRISPSVQPLLDADISDDPAKIVEHAVRANIRSSVRDLKAGSPIVERWIEEDNLCVVGAEYSLETGIVEFFDRVPGAIK